MQVDLEFVHRRIVENRGLDAGDGSFEFVIGLRIGIGDGEKRIGTVPWRRRGGEGEKFDLEGTRARMVEGEEGGAGEEDGDEGPFP
jgi:hypothetical protein